MLIPVTPLMWSSVQISLIAMAVLIVALLLKGRHPQFTSAILAGSSLAILAMALMAWLPLTHWSLTDLGKYSQTSIDGSEQHTATEEDFLNQTLTASGENLAGNLAGNVAGNSEEAEQFSNSAVSRGSPLELHQWLETVTNWTFSRVQQIDDQVRAFQKGSDHRLVWLDRLQSVFLGLLASFSLLWFASWLWMRAMIRSSRLLNDAALQVKVQQRAVAIGLRRVPELRTSARIAVGATIGCRRKIVILSDSWQQWSELELDAVLLHEMAHILRNDYSWVVLSSWLRVVLFYHPLVHFMVRRWRMEQELAADQLAAGVMNNARAYGRALASLALRVQSRAKMPSPVLTAEQVCIVRRVTMLKQGSLKPSRYGWQKRWTASLVVLTVLLVLPLSGLRGTPVALNDDPAKATTAENEKQETATPELPEDVKKKAEEFQQTQLAFPPLEFTGRLKWSPDKLLTEEVSSTARYLQDLIAFAFFEQVPAGAEVNCPASMKVSWEEMERKHGRVEFGAMAKETHGLDPELALRMLTSRAHGAYEISSHKKKIAGHDAIGLVLSQWNYHRKTTVTESEPDLWLVKDEESFYFGSEEDVARRIQRAEGKPDKTEDDPLIEVPSEFVQDYSKAALAVVYSDCQQWAQRIKKFSDGSPRKAEFAVVYPFLSGLELIGLFVTGDDGLTISARLKYDSATAAERGAKGFSSLIAMGKSASNESGESLVGSLLGSLRIAHEGSEVSFQLQDSSLLQQISNQILTQKLLGWNDILTTAKPDGAGGVMLESGYPTALTGFLSQTIKAKKYRGQRVRLSAELGCSDAVHQRSGVIVWGSDSQMASVGNAASGSSIGRVIDVKDAFNELLNRQPDTQTSWRTETVEWNVPDNAEAISFGVYTAAGNVMIRNVKFEIIGPSTSAEAEYALKDKLPRNMMHIPTLQLADEPVNMDLMQVNATQSETSSARTADAEATVEEQIR